MRRRCVPPAPRSHRAGSAQRPPTRKTGAPRTSAAPRASPQEIAGFVYETIYHPHPNTRGGKDMDAPPPRESPALDSEE